MLCSDRICLSRRCRYQDGRPSGRAVKSGFPRCWPTRSLTRASIYMLDKGCRRGQGGICSPRETSASGRLSSSSEERSIPAVRLALAPLRTSAGHDQLAEDKQVAIAFLRATFVSRSPTLAWAVKPSCVRRPECCTSSPPCSVLRPPRSLLSASSRSSTTAPRRYGLLVSCSRLQADAFEGNED
jgi:hypothetical protein